MTDTTSPRSRRTGIAAVAAGVLMFVPVAVELVFDVQRPDLTVTNAAGFAAFVLGWTAGAAALVLALHGLGRGGPAGLPTSGRVGRRLTLTGAALLTGFGLAYTAGWLITGTPVEAAFWLFLLGFLLLVIGSVPLAAGLRHDQELGSWSWAVVAAGTGALVAILTQSPWHEVGMFVFDGAWVVLGLRLLRADRHPVQPADRARVPVGEVSRLRHPDPA